MGSFFLEDNVFNRAMTKIFDLCVLNLLAVICCIPIVTGGASLTAMYAVMLKMAKNEEGPVLRSFFKEFKQNLKDSVGAWLLIAAGFVILLLDLYLWTRLETEYRSLFWGLTLAMILALCALTDWYLALRARFINTAKKSFVNAVKFALVYLPASVLMGAYSVGAAYLLTRFPMYGMLIPFFGFALLLWPKAVYIRGKFDIYMEDKGMVEKKEEDVWTVPPVAEQDEKKDKAKKQEKRKGKTRQRADEVRKQETGGEQKTETVAENQEG